MHISFLYINIEYFDNNKSTDKRFHKVKVEKEPSNLNFEWIFI